MVQKNLIIEKPEKIYHFSVDFSGFSLFFYNILDIKLRILFLVSFIDKIAVRDNDLYYFYRKIDLIP